jgi:hypothetical protein
MIREKYPKLYIYFFLCCRADRWAREEKQRAKNLKNEETIAKIEEVQYFMKDMKSLYISRVNYEGHENFMKMLFDIETMKKTIDLTIKKNEYNIDGKIARERRFDPEHLDKALDDKKLEIQESFESKGSFSNSESFSKKRGRSVHPLDDQSERYIPATKDDLFQYFGVRDNISKINKKRDRLDEELTKEKGDLAPYPNEAHEEEMKVLEGYIKKRLHQPVNKSMYKKENTSSLENSVKKSIYSTHQPDTSIEELDNTTTNILQGYPKYEEDLKITDNLLSNTKASRNAKILMTRTNMTPTDLKRSFKPKKSYLPEGEDIEEDKLEVRDYDSETERPSQSPNVLKSPISERQHQIDILKMVKKSLNNMVEKKMEKLEAKNTSVVKESNSSSDSDESSPTPTPRIKEYQRERRKNLQYPQTNNLIAPGIQEKRKSILKFAKNAPDLNSAGKP